MKINIIIPAYNEEKRIEKMLERYCKFFGELKKIKELDYEVIIVINNTTDNTEETVKEEIKKYPEIKYLNFKQGGKGFAIIEGFKNSLSENNDLIGFVDADMATPPEAFYDLVKNINRYDGIIASRWMKGANTKRKFTKRLISAGFNFIVRSLFLFPYKDTQCGAKLFKREVIEELVDELKITQWAFDVNLLYLCKKKKFKIKEYPTFWRDKKGSNITSIPKTSLQMFAGIIRLRLINSFLEPILRPVKFILRYGDRLLR